MSTETNFTPETVLATRESAFTALQECECDTSRADGAFLKRLKTELGVEGRGA
ncbi:MAG TPA: hypothetical protein VEA59_06840 [Patescibacteria group bacterium]|nr:hypothetical protein [Patescibacteria group bacterium]